MNSNSSIFAGSAARPARRAFTLVEVIVSLGLLSFLLLMMISVTDSASRAWREGRSRTDTFQSARTALELMARELAPAVVDTHTQFIIGPKEIVTTRGANLANAAGKLEVVAENAPVILWMAPLGDHGRLHCLGYYLTRDPAQHFYRLKRIFIPPPAEAGPESFYPRMIGTGPSGALDPRLKTSPTNARWFNRTWTSDTFDEDQDGCVVSTAADGVIALWVQPIDLLGRPIPRLSQAAQHPRATDPRFGSESYELEFNSAAFFQVATTLPFEDGASFLYLAHNENPGDESYHTMKANRVPAAVEITLVTLDQLTLKRRPRVPQQPKHADDGAVVDVAQELSDFQQLLREAGIHTSRTFTTRVKLVNGS